MMIEEFEKRTGIFVTSRLYKEIERRYMELDIDKDTFCKNYKANKNGLAESIQIAFLLYLPTIRIRWYLFTS